MKAHNAPETKIKKGVPNKMPKQIKLLCELCFNEFMNDSFLYNERSKVYDFLKHYGYINYSNDEVREFYRKAYVDLYNAEMKKDPKEINIHKLQGNKSLVVIFKAKVIALEQYFTKIDAENKTLNDILL